MSGSTSAFRVYQLLRHATDPRLFGQFETDPPGPIVNQVPGRRFPKGIEQQRQLFRRVASRLHPFRSGTSKPFNAPKRIQRDKPRRGLPCRVDAGRECDQQFFRLRASLRSFGSHQAFVIRRPDVSRFGTVARTRAVIARWCRFRCTSGMIASDLAGGSAKSSGSTPGDSSVWSAGSTGSEAGNRLPGSDFRFTLSFDGLATLPPSGRAMNRCVAVIVRV